MQRMHPGHTITSYVLVPSVTRFMAKVEVLVDERFVHCRQCGLGRYKKDRRR